MSNIEQGMSGDPRVERLKDGELYNDEREAWRTVLGVDVDVKPLPDFIDSQAQRKLDRMGLSLRYIPDLHLGNREYLQELGVERYLIELQRRYPNWRRFESLNVREMADHSISRNLEKRYWKQAKKGSIDFPVLPGQWMAAETVEKPELTSKYLGTPLAEKLGFGDDRFDVSWNDVHTAFKREKQRILSELGLAGCPVDLRMPEAHELNLLANREGWGKTDTYEWTNTEYRGTVHPARLVVGNSAYGGAACVKLVPPDISDVFVGFRAVVVFGS